MFRPQNVSRSQPGNNLPGDDPRELPWERALRLALAALAVAAALGTLVQLVEYRARRAEVLAWAAQAGLTAGETELLARLRREPSPERLQLRLARGLTAGQMVPGKGAGERDAPDGDSVARLVLARTLAVAAGRRLPASWEASLVTGMTTYLEWSRSRDRRLFLEAAAWEAPLQRAFELAPGRLEPALLLSTAYLELWPALSADKREQARQLARHVMVDPQAFRALVAPWLARAESPETAFAAIPPQPHAWRQVLDHYAQRKSWTAYRAASEHLDRVLAAEQQANLAQAEARLRGGDLRRARNQFLAVAAEARPFPASDPLIERALTLCPPGAGHFPALQPQLDRVLTLAPLRPLGLTPRVVGRMAAVTGELPPYDEALALLLAGDLPAAETLERRAGRALWEREWVPYLLAKARHLVRRGEHGDARQALDQVHLAGQRRLAYALAELELASAAGPAAALVAARARLASFAHRQWPAQAWHPQGSGWLLEWWGEAPADGFVLTFSQAPERGAAVELLLDGYSLGVQVARRGGRLELHQPLPAGEPHVLQLTMLAGGNALPERLDLLPLR